MWAVNAWKRNWPIQAYCTAACGTDALKNIEMLDMNDLTGE